MHGKPVLTKKGAMRYAGDLDFYSEWVRITDLFMHGSKNDEKHQTLAHIYGALSGLAQKDFEALQREKGKDNVYNEDTLKELYLSWNSITRIGGDMILDGIQNRNALRVLDFSWCALKVEPTPF